MAAQIVRGLRAIGAEVWWDEDMPGVDWQLELDRQIHELGCVVVLWTPSSVASRHVRDEARLADSQQKLINALDGVTKPSFPFDRVNGLPLDGWDGHESHNGWDRLVKTVEDYLVKVGSVQPGALSMAQDKLERDIRRKQAAVERAEETFQQAKTQEDEAETACVEAQAALTAAEAQLRRVSELQASSRLLLAAQADFDECRKTKADADKARRDAGAALATASRALTRARNEVSRMFSEPSDEAVEERKTTDADDQDTTPTPVVLDPTPHPDPDETGDEARGLGRTVVPTPPSPKPPPSPPTPLTDESTDDEKTKPAPSPLQRFAPAAVIAGLLTATLVGIILMFSGHPTPKPEPANTVTDTNMANANVSPAPAPAPEAQLAAVGSWSGSGTNCDNPLKVAVAAGSGGKTISMTMLDSVTTGAVKEVQADGTLVAQMSDGVWSYQVSGDTLSVKAPSGAQLTYTRCAG